MWSKDFYFLPRLLFRWGLREAKKVWKNSIWSLQLPCIFCIYSYVWMRRTLHKTISKILSLVCLKAANKNARVTVLRCAFNSRKGCTPEGVSMQAFVLIKWCSELERIQVCELKSVLLDVRTTWRVLGNSPSQWEIAELIGMFAKSLPSFEGLLMTVTECVHSKLSNL